MTLCKIQQFWSATELHIDFKDFFPSKFKTNMEQKKISLTSMALCYVEFFNRMMNEKRRDLPFQLYLPK